MKPAFTIEANAAGHTLWQGRHCLGELVCPESIAKKIVDGLNAQAGDTTAIERKAFVAGLDAQRWTDREYRQIIVKNSGTFRVFGTDEEAFEHYKETGL